MRAKIFVTVLAALALASVAARWTISAAEADGRLCRITDSGAAPDPFRTNMSCWDSRTTVSVGTSYRVSLTVQEPWHDESISAGPEGFEPSRLPWLSGYLGLPLRRSLAGRWFQPCVTIEAPDGQRLVQILNFRREDGRYVASFVPALGGNVLVWVNDAVVGFTGLTSYFYINNQGSATIVIEPDGIARRS